MPPRRLRERDALWHALLGAWALVMFAGGGLMWRYKLTPAEVAVERSDRWPAASTLSRADDVATLVMLVHPRCACTRASVAELGRLMSEARGRVRAHVLVVRPPAAPERWERTALWDSAAAIPGVVVQADIDGEEARLFGATASGHVVVYDPSGRLLFRGGITGGRGHEGDNPGRSQASAAILQRLESGEGPSFGCDLLSRDEMAGRDHGG